MKIKTSELKDRALDYAVAVAEGGTGLYFDTVATWWIKLDGKDRALSKGWSATQSYYPSTGPAGDDIIDREKISTHYIFNNVPVIYWQASLIDAEGHAHMRSGTTRREAAMRCFISAKLGEFIDIPEELICDESLRPEKSTED